MFSRSFLFVPSHEERYFLSAKNTVSDYVVLDLKIQFQNLKNFARVLKKKFQH